MLLIIDELSHNSKNYNVITKKAQKAIQFKQSVLNQFADNLTEKIFANKPMLNATIKLTKAAYDNRKIENKTKIEISFT